MSPSSIELQVPESLSLEELKQRIAGFHGFSQEPERSLHRSFLETFDWRVHDAGGVLESVTDGKHSELVWRKRKNGDVQYRVPLDGTPGFVTDLPAGPLLEGLKPVLEMRTLQPLVRIESLFTTLRVLDEEEKTVVRLEWEKARYLDADGEYGGELGTRVHLHPVRGYGAEFAQVARQLDELLESTGSSLLDAALQAIGRQPGDYSSKLNYTLDPEQRADQATKTIMLGLLRTLEVNIEGSRADVDSEYLHDLRVATRRTRSALTQIKAVFAPELVERYKSGFAWVQQVTGPTRDMDVYLMALDDLKGELPPRLRDALEPLRGFLHAHHAQEQQAMSRKLASPHFRKILKEWRAFLETPAPDRPAAANSDRLIRKLADERIWKMFRRVLKEGRTIGDESPAEDLHELRKSCKKLRYLMEFFSSLYQGKQIKTLIKVLKVLLDNLGNFQDLEVQSDKLQHFAVQMVQEGDVGADTLLAMGALIGGLSKRQLAARDEFARIFAGFDTQEHRLLFKTLFRSDGEVAA